MSFSCLGKGHGQAALSLWNNMLEPVGAKQSSWHMGEELKCPSTTYPYIFTKSNSADALADYQRSTAAQKSSTTRSAHSTSHHHKHHKSERFWTTYNIVAVVAIGLIFLMLIIAGVSRRQQIRGALHGAGRRHISGFKNPQCSEDIDDIEIWKRDQMTKTHGTRINFDA